MKFVMTLFTVVLASGITLSQTCDPLEGTASPGTIAYSLNPFKNRTHAPTTSQINSSISLNRILQPGNDVNRFHNTDGATIEGYVISTKLEGKESCNCGATDTRHRDYHIMVASNPNETDKSKMMIVEISPKIRATKPVDWSPAKIADLVGHKVRFTGWMLCDKEHQNVARNTRTNRSTTIQRATVWEIHPVTYFVITN